MALLKCDPWREIADKCDRYTRALGWPRTRVQPNVAKVGGLQSPGIKSEAVVDYRDPLITQDLKSSGFPER